MADGFYGCNSSLLFFFLLLVVLFMPYGYGFYGAAAAK